jgi:hypothetical protein
MQLRAIALIVMVVGLPTATLASQRAERVGRPQRFPARVQGTYRAAVAKARQLWARPRIAVTVRPRFEFEVTPAGIPSEQISSVEYLLHPTYPTPVRTMVTPPFSLQEKAWGTGFTLLARTQFKDGGAETVSAVPVGAPGQKRRWRNGLPARFLTREGFASVSTPGLEFRLRPQGISTGEIKSVTYEVPAENGPRRRTLTEAPFALSDRTKWGPFTATALLEFQGGKRRTLTVRVKPPARSEWRDGGW